MKTLRTVLITVLICMLISASFIYIFIIRDMTAADEKHEEDSLPSQAVRTVHEKKDYVPAAPDPLEELYKHLDEINSRGDMVLRAADLVNGDNLYHTVDVICTRIGNRVSGERENYEARQYIIGELRSYGYEYPLLYTQGFYSKFEVKDPPEKRTDYYEPDDPAPVYRYSANVIAKLPGKSADAPIIIVSAHYDSAPTDAIIDNGSGVALALEAARIMKENDFGLDCEYRFCFFSGEEQGLHGAFSYMATMDDEEYEKIIAVINVDMAIESTKNIEQVLTVGTDGGYDWDGVYRVGTKTEPQENLITYCARYAYHKLGLDESKLVCPYANAMTDSVAFHRFRKDAVTFSIRERNADGTISAPEWIHTDKDTIENTVVSTMKDVTRIVIATAVACGQAVSE